jgi:hypothetical protein
VKLSDAGEQYTLEEGDPLEIVIRGVPQRVAVGQPIVNQRPEQRSPGTDPGRKVEPWIRT